MKRKLLLAALLVAGALGMRAQMSDVTDTYITNAGFETDEAASDLTGSSTQNTPTGWTISPSSLSNTQWGTANSSTKIQGNSASQAQSAGDNYFYFRDNWQNGTNISVSQASKAEVPAGNYIVYVDVFTYSNNGTQPVYTFTVGDGSTTYVNGSITANAKEWRTYYYHFKLDAAATLTFSANMTPKAAASGKHDWMLLDNIRLLKADNPQTPVANNTTDLYLYNEKEGMYVSAGHSWGTHSTVDNYGYEMTAALSNGTYTLKTQQYNAYLGGLYMDAGSVNWLFLGTGESGKYYLTQDGYNYMSSNGAGAELVNVTTPTDASVWSIVSKADRKAAFSSATIDNPANATFLIADANFNRNAISSVWNGTSKTSDNKTNLNLAGGNNDNMCAESYHATFSISQTLSSMPVGVYALTAQGFYRQDGSDNDHLPYFYIADETATFPVKTGSENSMANASTSFSAGLYTIEPIYYRLDAEDDIEVGAKLENENYNLWCIWDNFQLTYYGDVTVAAVKMKASVDAYNAAMTEAEAFTESSMFAADWTTLQSAITANTLDLNDPALTEDNLTTATANLVAANAAATAAVTAKTTYNTAVTTIDGGTNVDLTALVTNNGFELGNTNGWTNDGAIAAQAQGNKAFDNTQDSYFAERWHASGTIDINQTVTALPAGIYKVEAYMYSDTGDAALYANSTTTSVSTSKKYAVVVEIADKGSIKLGASCTLTNSTWICMDDFTLTYLGTVNDLEYTKATGKMGTDKSDAQDEAETTFLTEKNLANYNALLEAIAAAEASKANYVALKAAIDKAEAVRDANNFVTAAATTALQKEIDDATDAWTDVTYTDAQATAEIAALGSAVSGWHGIGIEGKSGAFMASAWGKTSENWWDAPYINTWSVEGDNDGSGFSVPFFEYFTDNDKNLNTATFTATLTGLEDGLYEVELWARVQRRSDADFNGDNSMITMSVNGGDAVSIMSNTSNNVGSGASVMRLGRYTATGMVTGGTLTLSIDVKLGSNVHWLCWRDVNYTKIADATVDVTIGETGYTTFAYDYALDLDNLPSGLEAYYIKSDGVSGDYVTLTAADGQVPAGEGLILKGTANQSYTIPVYASGTALDGNKLVGCTSEKPVDVNADKYVLVNNDGTAEFQNLSEHAATIPAGKAYLDLSGAAAKARLAIILDGEANDIDEVEIAEDGDDDAPTVNVAGQTVGKDYKGIVIKAGKKYLQR